MNNIGMYFTFILIFGPLRGGTMPFTPLVKYSSRLPLVVGKMHSGFFLVVIIAIIIYLIYTKTVFGFQIRSVGTNPQASKYAGIDTYRVVLTSAMIGGGFAGLAGAMQVIGVHYYMWEHISHGYGFFGIITAFLGKLNFFGILFAGVFLGGLISGSKPMNALTGVEAEFVTLLLGVIILFVVIIYSLERRMVRR
jgi:simple sugar transport system permease protein